ncbi:hypothetical protein CRE_06834 [Caenorhabditis remanei]|uniref:BTB domain-containing protein n=1 Tax=Caenorhabditis remanei TaxID=31234 RepID=E3MZH4_CAERE|nr:hypothetical protein CRE_06834 [Caenorhabditis remanei]
MVYEIITYKSAEKTTNSLELIALDTSTTNGLVCVMKAAAGPIPYMSWAFDWEKLKADRVIGFTGEIIVKKPYELTVPVDIITEKPEVTHIFQEPTDTEKFQFEFSVLPILCTEIYDEMFLPSEKNDAILEVGGVKLNVNRTFLSYHSDYFSALFSSNFKEGKMDEVPIKDVSYEEIGLLFSTIYPKATFPNDKTVPKLLELADRFMMPSVIHHVEYHLLNNTKINNEKLMWMADRYGMKLLLEKMIKELDSMAKAKMLKDSPDYGELSDQAKGKILDKVMVIIDLVQRGVQQNVQQDVPRPRY